MTPERNFDLIKTNFSAHSSDLLKECFSNFLKKPVLYKEQFLQNKMNTVFDGYSFLGQEDSLNQYDTDLLHSFVLSEFSSKESFPVEFHNFFENEWSVLQKEIKKLERKLISTLNIKGLEELYNHKIGHMVSCNYYPNTKNISAKNFEHRLSEHKDVSLFTVFVYGNSNGFCYKNTQGKNIKLGEIDQIVVFPGYLLEVLTKGKIKATEHQVEFDKNNTEERFSFAFFSIPKPKETLELTGISSEDYYQQYLDLF